MDVKELETELSGLNTKFTEAGQRIADLEAKNSALETEKSQMIAASNHNQGGSRMSLENQIVKTFGANSLRDLVRVNTAHPRYAAVAPEMKAQIIQLKQDIDIARSMAQMFHGDRPDGDLESDAGISHCKNLLNSKFAKEVDLGGRIKAFGSTVSGGGDEFVPTLISDQYLEEIQLIKQVPGLFREFPMPSNPFKLPMTTNYTVARIIAEDNAATNVNFNTTDVQYDAKKFFEYYLLPEELNEDSAPPILAIARQEVSEAIIRAYERAIIDGDTTGTHMDSDVTAASDARKAYIGLRKKALANSANGSVVDFGSAFTYQKYSDMKAAGGIAMVNPKELALILGPAGYNQALGLDEVATVDKAGTMATLFSGSLASLGGVPIITSQFIRENLNASGVYDGVTTDNTTCLLVNIRRFMIGMRRPIRVKAQRDARPEFDRWQLVSYSRAAFNGAPQGASEVSVVVGVNITV